MKHRTFGELTRIARVARSRRLSKRQRLLRWASALQHRRGVQLNTFKAIEHMPRKERLKAKVENSPLTVAAEDPVLYSAGLRGDSIDDVTRFFRLSHWQLHELVCHCNHGDTVAAEAVALRVQRLANRTTSLAVAIVLLAAMVAVSMLVSTALHSLAS